MVRANILALLASSIVVANAFPTTPINSNTSPRGLLEKRAPCASTNGTFTIAQTGLYPENADFDNNSCLLYLGVLFNASIAVYSPYTSNTTVIEFTNITRNPEFHIGGVAASPYTNLLSVVVDAAAAFTTQGKDTSGTNILLLLDPSSKREIYRLNLTQTTQGKYSGFQDLEFDARGNVYVVGSFPASILRVEGGATRPSTGNGTAPKVSVNEWFKSPAPSTKNGMAGLAAHGDILLANDNAGLTSSSLVRFDMTASKGTPIPVPISNNRSIAGSDALQLPSKYNGTVLLAALDASGVEVLRSRDGRWETAEGLGQVSNKRAEAGGGTVTGTVQIGSRILMIEEFFADGPNGGNRTSFPMVDITDEVERLVRM